MENLITTYAEGLHHIDLAVVPGDGVVDVVGGAFSSLGLSYEMPATRFTVTRRDAPTVVYGYLLIDTENDSAPELLVDEVVQDGNDAPYKFPRDGRYNLLSLLFHLVVPAGITDLRGIKFNRWRVIRRSHEGSDQDQGHAAVGGHADGAKASASAATGQRDRGNPAPEL